VSLRVSQAPTAAKPPTPQPQQTARPSTPSQVSGIAPLPGQPDVWVSSVPQVPQELRQPQTLHLRTWAERIASRRVKKTAVMALARKLAGILFAMRRDGTAYTPPQLVQAAAACLETEAAAA